MLPSEVEQQFGRVGVGDEVFRVHLEPADIGRVANTSAMCGSRRPMPVRSGSCDGAKLVMATFDSFTSAAGYVDAGGVFDGGA